VAELRIPTVYAAAMLRVSAPSIALAAVAACAFAGNATLSAAKSGEPAPRAAIVSAVRAPYEALSRREPAALCASFTPTVAAQLVARAPAGSSCEAAVAEAFTRAGPSQSQPAVSWRASWVVTNVVVYGTRASATLRYGDEGSDFISLRELAGKWLVSSPARLVAIVGCTVTAQATPCRANARVALFLVSSGQALLPIPPAITHAGGQTLRKFTAGSAVYMQSGCAACHRIGSVGNTGPGPNLTHVGARLSPAALTRAIVHATAPMPSFTGLPHAKLQAIVEFLALLR
jgi:mono/diheme cytochrome c family protein